MYNYFILRVYNQLQYIYPDILMEDYFINYIKTTSQACIM